PRGGEAVVLGVAPALRGVPVCRDPAAILEALERWIERPRIDRQDTLGDLSDAVGDPPAVHRRERQCLEHEHVERALDDVAAAILWRHGFLSIIERYDSYLSIVKRWASVRSRPWCVHPLATVVPPAVSSVSSLPSE